MRPQPENPGNTRRDARMYFVAAAETSTGNIVDTKDEEKAEKQQPRLSRLIRRFDDDGRLRRISSSTSARKKCNSIRRRVVFRIIKKRFLYYMHIMVENSIRCRRISERTKHAHTLVARLCKCTLPMMTLAIVRPALAGQIFLGKKKNSNGSCASICTVRAGFARAVDQ
ncbi:hypothetical protein Q1695_010501 [Nippostrongylus brasiliensis]|nr:hypothetical protein Q1695_010501 [Nippostrongylus brasiliensis]